MPDLSLDGTWSLYHFQQREFSIHHPHDLNGINLQPIQAVVPGNAELDLERSGHMGNPFYAENIHNLRSLETHDWWYVRSFSLGEEFAGKKTDLVCEGLDTYATVWVNGTQIGQSKNMLVEQRFDVTHALLPGEENKIAIRLASSILEARTFQYDANQMSWEHRYEGLHIRKAAHMWGWDIMPRAVSAGIWRSVHLESVPENAIESIYYWTVDADEQRSVLGIRFQLRTPQPVTDGMVLHFRGECAEHTFEYDWPLEFIADGCTFPVPGAKLWWPKGYGDPKLYTITAQLRQNGKLLAEHRERFGFRKLDVKRTEIAGPYWTPDPLPADHGRIDSPVDPQAHFAIEVNGVPIMIKGTNWVPLDAFHSRDAGRLERALSMVEDLGCNCIRCWGGNVYESQAFFDWCDAHGVLVWQDFAFACCIYPQSEDFLAQVREEAEIVVRRLRNHPSLALWCGDNEIDMVYLSEGLDPRHNRLTREIIPQVIRRFDPHRHFIPSSPYISDKALQGPNPMNSSPEQHLWGPRGYYKSPFYMHHSAHFIGEIGYHGCPNVSSIRKFISPGKQWPWQDNDEWQTHAVYHWTQINIERDRIELMAKQIRELFGQIPGDLPTFALASQITQAEAKKFFIESTRLRKWRTSGILWWNLLDGWPQFSDAVVDYYFSKKLAYHYIRRVQHPICVFIGETGTGKYLPVILSNDSRRDVVLRYQVRDADTEEILCKREAMVPANQNHQVGRIRTYASEQRMLLLEWEMDGASFGNHYLAGTPPFSLERYRAWLVKIAALQSPFEADKTAV